MSCTQSPNTPLDTKPLWLDENFSIQRLQTLADDKQFWLKAIHIINPSHGLLGWQYRDLALVGPPTGKIYAIHGHIAERLIELAETLIDRDSPG